MPLLTSFPGLPVFVLVFVQYITRNRKNSKKSGRPGLIHHVSGREVDIGGRGQYLNINLKAGFLPVKLSSFDHANV